MSTTPRPAGHPHTRPNAYWEITEQMVDAELARQEQENTKLLFEARGKRKLRWIVVASVVGFLIPVAIAVTIAVMYAGVFAHHGPTAQQQAAQASQQAEADREGAANAAIAACEEAITQQLYDPTAALFTSVIPQNRNAVTGMPGSIYGHVNGKNLYGGYVGARPFACVMNADGTVDQAAISSPDDN